jgi:transposase InsO family protein
MLTALFRRGLSGQLGYRQRNHIRKWVQILAMQIDRIRAFWRGSPKSARRWLQRFRHHYNHERPNRALDDRTPAEEVLN